ncbi:hypothetical protein J7F01_41335 [Streptomyces sp. ISL-22]|uniref:trypsin-like serine peptidase n=1 Tax=unclassified Streptomyces TaxID=2593676 RepID=UPI001BEB7B64|nr:MULTISPECIES: hypothetical protein [unclassified Streptomyces]MBT2423424.1 hypothetical protein [Streptomyces sp. ISL-24]MBT2438433.1 hypothetical protein [Streptomyces sp. ISL-22]
MASRRLRRLQHGTAAALAAATIGLGMFTAPPAAANASGSGSEPSSVVTEQATSAPGQIRDFWTPERVRAALANPLDTPATGPTPVYPKSGTTSGPEIQTVSADAVPPKDASTGSTRTEDVATTASAPTVSRSVRVANELAWPYRATGKLIFDTPKGGANCSASVIVSNTKNAVWTAAHCLHSGKGGAFYKNFLFLPGYNGLAPYHWWEQDRVMVPTNWVNYGDLDSSDMGALIVKKDLALGNLQDLVGGYGYNFSDGPEHTDVHSFGYPADGYNRPDSDFNNGEYMMYCRGNTVDGGPWNLLDERLRMNCDMGHGSSGGPMVTGVAAGNIQIVGVNSHRHVDSNGNWSDNYLFSSEHASEARSLIYKINS